MFEFLYFVGQYLQLRLIDHPYFWHDEYRITFVKTLKDLFKENKLRLLLVDKFIPDLYLVDCIRAYNNDLLEAICSYKSRAKSGIYKMVFYMNAVYSHINDNDYDEYRKSEV